MQITPPDMSAGFLPHCSATRCMKQNTMTKHTALSECLWMSSQVHFNSDTFFLIFTDFICSYSFSFFMKSSRHTLSISGHVCTFAWISPVTSFIYSVSVIDECSQAEWVVVGMKWELKEISSATSHSDWLPRHDAVPAARAESCLIKKAWFNFLVVGPAASISNMCSGALGGACIRGSQHTAWSSTAS